MTDAKGKADQGEEKATKGAMKEAIGIITGDQAAESDGAEDKAAGRKEAKAARRREGPETGEERGRPHGPDRTQ